MPVLKSEGRHNAPINAKFGMPNFTFIRAEMWCEVSRVRVMLLMSVASLFGGVGSNPTAATKCEVSRVRVMLLMSVAYNFFLFTTRPTILLLVYLPLNSITNTKTVIQ